MTYEEDEWLSYYFCFPENYIESKLGKEGIISSYLDPTLKEITFGCLKIDMTCVLPFITGTEVYFSFLKHRTYI